jgi:hypothetical protein
MFSKILIMSPSTHLVNSLPHDGASPEDCGMVLHSLLHPHPVHKCAYQTFNRKKQCCGSGMFILDPGSEFFIADPRSGSATEKI